MGEADKGCQTEGGGDDDDLESLSHFYCVHLAVIVISQREGECWGGIVFIAMHGGE